MKQKRNKYYAGDYGTYILNGESELSLIMGVARQVADRWEQGYATTYTYSVDDTGEFVSILPGTDITEYIVWAINEHGEITIDTQEALTLFGERL